MMPQANGGRGAKVYFQHFQCAAPTENSSARAAFRARRADGGGNLPFDQAVF